MSKVLFDTNVLVYSSNTLSPKYKKAVKERKKAVDGVYQANISHQNIMEMIRVLTHGKYENPMNIKDALKQVNAIKSFCTVISPTIETDEVALKLIEKYGLASNAIFDAYLVATMLCNEIYIVISDNQKHLGIFEEIEVVNPF